MAHALFLLVFVLFAGDLMAFVPLAALAAILLMIAWGMSEVDRFIGLLRMPIGERGVLLLTFFLTVLVDLTVAIGVGVTIASLLFMARISETVTVSAARADAQEDATQRDGLPEDVEVFRIAGPVFFGVAGELLDALARTGRLPRAIILRMELVPYLDATGVAALQAFVKQAQADGTAVILSGARSQPFRLLKRNGLGRSHGAVWQAQSYEAALRLAGNTNQVALERGRKRSGRFPR